MKNAIASAVRKEKEKSNDHLTDEGLINNDVNFCIFYYKAVKQLLDIDNKANVSYLYRYVKIFIEYYDKFCQVRSNPTDQDDTIVKLLQNSLYYRVIYVYRNATLLSSAVAFHLWNIHKEDPNIIQRLTKKKLVKICSVGGSSAPEIVAIITVLKSIAFKSGIELDFRVTVIDINTDWKNTCITVLRCLDDFHKATWKINFIQCKFANTKAWTAETLNAIREADIITMVKFISKLHIKRNVVNMICGEIRSEAMFVALDRPSTSIIELYLSICDLDGLHLVDVELCDYYTLDLQAVRHSRTLYLKHFGNEKLLRSNVSCNLFVSVWTKASSEKGAKLKDNLESVFQTNAEKYNPKRNFLGSNNFTKWQKLFTKKKQSAGWNTKRIKEYVQKEKQKRSNIFGKFIHEKKGVDSLQNRLLSHVQSSENDEEEFINKALDDYLIHKRQYSLMKKNAFFASLSANNLYSSIE